MKLNIKKEPRTFSTGNGSNTISDMGSIELSTNEQLTFVDGSSEYDVAKTVWGYYATPSTNQRLKNFGFKTALVVNPESRLYVLLVQNKQVHAFQDYLTKNKSKVIAWLDEDNDICKLLDLNAAFSLKKCSTSIAWRSRITT